jgi:hypothetical protein
MSDRTRNRINAAFDDELSASPVPASLRSLSIRDAVSAPPRRSIQPQLLVVIATIVVVALVATFVIGSHILRSTMPLPAGSTSPPAPRANAASTYDAAHGVMLVFGGGTGPNPPTNETWTWDGKYWRHLHPAASPSAREGSVMAYDAAHGNVVMYGGAKLAGLSAGGGCCNLSQVDDTWTWDGATWQLMHPKHQPQFGYEVDPARMQFDPVTKSVLMIGNRVSSTLGGPTTSEMWSWNGSDWKQLSPTTLPDSRVAMLSDGSHVLLLAGANTGGRFMTQTYAWDGSNWNVLKLNRSLPELGLAGGAYDPSRGQLVLLTSDTWMWEGSTWSRAHPSLQPQTFGYMAYMPSLHEVVSWGDRMASVDNEMFGWDGSDWKVLEPGSAVWPVTNGKGMVTTRMSPEQAAALVRSTVKNTSPVLLPASLPSGGPWDALVQVTPDDFNIQYESDQRDKTITFGIVVANPPPGQPNASDTWVKFRNSEALKYHGRGFAEYFVYDPTSPTSQRWLTWSEPGSMANPMLKDPGVPYFLSASGLTDQEFWQVANSLQ